MNARPDSVTMKARARALLPQSLILLRINGHGISILLVTLRGRKTSTPSEHRPRQKPSFHPLPLSLLPPALLHSFPAVSPRGISLLWGMLARRAKPESEKRGGRGGEVRERERGEDIRKNTERARDDTILHFTYMHADRPAASERERGSLRMLRERYNTEWGNRIDSEALVMYTISRPGVLRKGNARARAAGEGRYE